MVKKEYKEKLIKLINKYLPEAKIYLFGSRATGEYSQYSDIDIALDAGEKIEKEKIASIRLSIDDLNIPLDIDIIDFNSISPTMKSRILKERIIWKK
ncbi:MAG: nucleotidyltransferase domain-containing protein [bacterium]